jgi:PAS domain S-box-containing protein
VSSSKRSSTDEALELFTQTGDGVWATDGNRRIVLWNQAAEDLLGYTAEQAIGQFGYQFLGRRDAQGRPFCSAMCSVRKAAQLGQAVEAFAAQVRHRDGHAVWINVSIVALPERPEAGHDVTLVHLFRLIGQGTTWPPPLRIHLLGPVVVERTDGSLVGGPLWRRAKVRALLVLFALHRGQPFHRDTLVDTLWPEMEHKAALRNLNTTVYNLRRSLEPALQRGAESLYIGYEGECYALNGGRVHWLDVEDFETGIVEARRQCDVERAATLYRGALDLYRGDYAADLDPDMLHCWMERERLRQLYLNVLEELATLCAKQGQDREADEVYLKVLAQDPCRECAAQELVRLALRRGDRAAAVAHCRRLEEALWRDLRIPPGQETELLCQQARGEGK